MWKNTSKNQVQQYMQQNPYRLLALAFGCHDHRDDITHVAHITCSRP